MGLFFPRATAGRAEGFASAAALPNPGRASRVGAWGAYQSRASATSRTASRWPAAEPVGVVMLKEAPHSLTMSAALAEQSLLVSRLRTCALAALGLNSVRLGALIMRVGKLQKAPFWAVEAPTPCEATRAPDVPAFCAGAVARGKVFA